MTKSIIVVTICYKLLCHSSRFLISNFLASTDIKSFWSYIPICNTASVGLALFLHPECFCLACNITRLPLLPMLWTINHLMLMEVSCGHMTMVSLFI